MRLPSLTRPALAVSLSLALLFAMGTAATALVLGDFGSYRPSVGYLLGMLVSLTLGVVVVHLAPDYVGGVADELGDRSGEFFVYGLITFAAFAVVAFVLGTTAIGILAVGALLPFAVFVALLSYAVVATRLGRALSTPDRSPVETYLVGAATVLVASQVPFLGGFLNLVVLCLGTGAVVGLWSDRGR